MADERRRQELAAIHTAKKQLGLDEATYRSFLEHRFRVQSSAALDERGRRACIEALREMGFSPKPAAQPSPLDPHARKIWALWKALDRAGALRSGTAKSLRAFVKKMTGCDDPAWLTADKANQVIEGLKAWLARAGIAEKSAEEPDEQVEGTR
jgi:phage gp16-like protein